MIKLYLGGIGSGKTVSLIKEMTESEDPFFTNFHTANIKQNNRLRVDNIIITDKDEKKITQKVNWTYWREQLKKHKDFNIGIDELHNIMHSRRSMSKFNVLMSSWIAQIRKICGDSEKTHFYAISQELERIDIAVRDLANVIIYCKKSAFVNNKIKTKIRNNNKVTIEMIPATYIMRHYFTGTNSVAKYLAYRDMGQKTYDMRSWFLANPYFQFYDSYELIDFGDSEFL